MSEGEIFPGRGFVVSDQSGLIEDFTPDHRAVATSASKHFPFLLSSGEVHVWRFCLDASAALLDLFWGLLSPDEEAKAERFKFEIDRRRFVAGRGCLRVLLARYANVSAAEIEFNYSDHGKPQINLPDSAPPLYFNLAHSDHLALYAFTRAGEIGIDIQGLAADFPAEEIAQRFFSPKEVSVLASLPPERRRRAFLNCWTRKEAFIKAKGLGLSLPLDHFDVDFASDESTVLLRTHWDENEAAQWSLRTFETEPGYAAAVAMRGQAWPLILHDVEKEIVLRELR